MLEAQQHAKPEPGSEEHSHKHVQETKEGETGAPNASSDGPNSDAGEKGEPEPEEEQPHQLSMDEEFRRWCHPTLRLNVHPISENLSRGVLAPSVEDEVAVAS